MSRRKLSAIFLALVLVFTMMPGTISYANESLKVNENIPDATLVSKDNGDGTYTVSIVLEKEGPMEIFDYGIVFEPDKAEVTTHDTYGIELYSCEWDSKFSNKYSRLNGVYTSNVFDTYVVFGGTSSTDFNYSGKVASVTLRAKNGFDPGSVAIVKDSSTYKKKLDIDMDMDDAINIAHAKVYDMNPMPLPMLSSKKNSDGTYTVDISMKGKYMNFDYALAYDSSEVEPVVSGSSLGYGFNSSLTSAEVEGSSYVINENNSESNSYIHFTGKVPSFTNYNGVVASVTLKLKDDVVNPDSVYVYSVTNPSQFADLYNQPLNKQTVRKYGYTDSTQVVPDEEQKNTHKEDVGITESHISTGIITSFARIALTRSGFRSVSGTSLEAVSLSSNDNSPAFNNAFTRLNNVTGITTAIEAMRMLQFSLSGNTSGSAISLGETTTITFNIPSSWRTDDFLQQLQIFQAMSLTVGAQDAGVSKVASLDEGKVITPKISADGTKATIETDSLGTFVMFINSELPTGYALGDVNNDTKIDLDDVTLALKIALTIIEPENNLQKTAVDVTKDNKIDLDDITLLLKVALTITQFE